MENEKLKKILKDDTIFNSSISKVDENINNSINNKVLKTTNLSLDTINEVPEKNLNKKQKFIESKTIYIIRLIVNSFLSLILIIIFIYVWFAYSPQWKILFFLTLWSYWTNVFYIISITLIDFFYLLNNYKCCKNKFKKNCLCCNCNWNNYNNFIRNYFLRISFPFAISIVLMYWILILLGDNFEGNPKGSFEIVAAFYMHGLVFLFLLFDTFTGIHININKKWTTFLDLGIITIILIIYYIVIGVGKYQILFDPYDFMMIANVRQIIASCIIIYVLVINGYIVFRIIANYFFKEDKNVNKEKNMKKSNNNNISGDNLKEIDSSERKELVQRNNENQSISIKENEENKINNKSDEKRKNKYKNNNVFTQNLIKKYPSFDHKRNEGPSFKPRKSLGKKSEINTIKKKIFNE